MTQRELAEIIALFNKLQIENNPSLTESEKEIYKQFIDYIKKLVK